MFSDVCNLNKYKHLYITEIMFIILIQVSMQLRWCARHRIIGERAKRERDTLRCLFNRESRIYRIAGNFSEIETSTIFTSRHENAKV